MPRKAQTDEEHQDIREALLATARHIYDREGFAAVTLRRVARESGYSPAALYKYFSGHGELLQAMWRDALGLLEQRMARAAAAHPAAPLARLRAVMQAYADFAREHPEAFRSTFLQLDVEGGPDSTGVSPDPRQDGTYLVLRGAVEEAMAAGLLRRMDPDAGAQLIWSLVHGAVALSLNMGNFPFGPTEERVRLAIDTVLRGLAPDRAPDGAPPRPAKPARRR